MKVGSLFSGGGLGDFGFVMAGHEIAWQVEIDEYCQKILALRYPESKKYRDIKTLKGAELEPVDIITGGFPCQPFSVAGKQYGADDDRNLWPEMLRIIKAVKPRYVVAENVPGIIPIYLDTVLADLGNAGYTCWPVVFSSHSLGAWHLRERCWIVAHSKRMRKLQPERREQDKREWLSNCRKDVSDSMQPGLQVGYEQGSIDQAPRRIESRSEFKRVHATPWRRYWEAEPNVGRVAHGVASRVDRLKMLGNGQTPCSTYVIGKYLTAVEGKMRERMK